MAKMFDILGLGDDIKAGMAIEAEKNALLRDLAERVKLATVDGLGRDDQSFAIATFRCLVIQKAVAEAMEQFDLAATLNIMAGSGQTNRPLRIGGDPGYA